MLISIILPACDAQATIGRAIRSLLDQDWRDWEAIVVADDFVDYESLLGSQGIHDKRLRFGSTGRHRSGCHRARNVGLAQARGELIGALDADDAFHPRRLSALAPVAAAAGAAADNLLVIAEEDGETMYPVLGDLAAPVRLAMDGFLRLTAPLVPLVCREHAHPRAEGVEYAEDVIANLRLIDRLGALVVTPERHYEYRIRTGSVANDDRAGDAFEQAYSDYIARVSDGDAFGIAHARREAARAGLVHKRALNRAFREASRADRTLNFQSFVTRSGRASGAPDRL